MNKDEFGVVIQFDVNEDIDSYTSIMYLKKPSGAVSGELTVTVGSTTITTEDGDTFTANQYVEYTTVEGDIDESGWWEAKVRTTFSATKELETDWKRFWVDD